MAGKQKSKTKKTKTRTKIVTKIRKVSKKVKSKIKKKSKTITETLIAIVPVIQSAQLLSENQLNDPSVNTNEKKMKAVINGLTGSTFDINFFDDVPQAHYNPSIEGMFNKWTITNVGLIFAGSVLKKFKVPHANKIMKTGKVSLIPSAIAGILGKKNTQKASTFHNSGTIQTSSIQVQTNGNTSV